MYKGLKWASYDDQTSIKAKVELASKYKLAGIMTWAIDLDDFLGKCTTTGVKFPLLTTVNRVLYQQERKQHGSKGKQNQKLSVLRIWYGLVRSVRNTYSKPNSFSVDRLFMI